MSNIIGNRNSTPETSSSSLGGSTLRPPRTLGSAGHHLRASADMGALSATSPLATRGIRPASEVYYNQFNQGGNSANPDEVAEKAAQQWIADIDQYETTLEEMAAATLDQDFKDELSAIEQWFRVLSEPERTAALYALLQQTTQVQIRFFIQVLQQMAKSHPMSGVLSPAAFNEKDPMSSRMNDAMNKLNVEGSRGSFGFGSKPPPSPGAKRMSGLDPNTIKSMFPDAANAIEDQKAEFQKTTGSVPKSNRNSAVGDRSSQYMPTISAPEDDKKNGSSGIPSGPWRTTSGSQGENQPPIGRPKSSSSQQQGSQAPMGQFGVSQAPLPSAGLRSGRPFPLSSDSNIQSQTASQLGHNADGMPILSPYAPGASWASMTNTPMVSNFSQQQSANQADMVANATAMKLAALSTVNNRLQLDDPRKYRRTRSSEGQNGQQPLSPGLPGQMPSSIMMTNEMGQALTPQQAAALQQHQINTILQGQRSRPTSPGIAITGPPGGNPGMNMAGMQNNGFLAAYDNGMGQINVGMAGLNMGNFGLANYGNEGYLSDASEINRGRSPRGRRGSSKPPEDPTDLALLRDIPNWLRTLRLHKYTDILKDMNWQDLVALDEEGLERKGVAAKGARTKLLKVFEQVQQAQQEGRL
ncbi:Putative sterile alpha motif domain-containing protein [Septoria linicola]|uniref:RNA-binding protein VTS1 n=1 Tax=Septoria linicola TaxID=215465 RepID=A0A9Q9ERZ4_9PEZI|nr:putative sterile alpha motif domain-containing protein [Septoria linicola]USW59073.1 Putative sterile alpha motif domain-containing protein [Septoria linicola]